MKLKRRPEDFRVDEEISLAADGGEFALYKLTKSSLGTLEAVAALRRHWKLAPGAVAFAGLKDKHALTTQHVTIHRGPPRGFEQSHVQVKYLGQVSRPVHASDIVVNRFEVALRDLSTAIAETAMRSAQRAASQGVPNYFDDQRFGSVGESGEFIAHPWCLGNYERALWLAMAEPNARDRQEQRVEKRFILEHWGQWSTIQQRFPRSAWSGVLGFLVDRPFDFRRAIAFVPHELRSLWLAAYQSHLWNVILSGLLEASGPPSSIIWQTVGRQKLAFVSELEPQTRERLGITLLPLPSARLHLNDSPLAPLYERALATHGMAMRQLRVKYPRDTFFSKGDRAAVVFPKNFSCHLSVDDLYSGRSKMTLKFSLPRAAYATMLIKQLVRREEGEGQSVQVESLADEE